MPYNLPIHFCDQRYRKGLCGAKCLNDELLCVAAEFQSLKRGNGDLLIALTSASDSLLIIIFGSMCFLFLLLASQLDAGALMGLNMEVL